MDKVKAAINRRIKDHVAEVEATVLEAEKRQKKIKDNKDFETAKEILVLKDKIIFHKACAMVLQDLLEEINGIHETKD